MKSLLVRFGVVCVVGLVARLGVIALRPRAPGHANADVCRDDDFGPSATKAFKDANANLDEARAAFDRATLLPRALG